MTEAELREYLGAKFTEPVYSVAGLELLGYHRSNVQRWYECGRLTPDRTRRVHLEYFRDSKILFRREDLIEFFVSIQG